MDERVKELAIQICNDLGFDLYDIEFKNTDKGKVLRVYITSSSGVKLDACAVVSRKLNYELDIIDIIPHQYYLEVSSPGLERPLNNESQFRQAIGEIVKATYRKDGKTITVQGVLNSVTPQSIIIDNNDNKESTTEEISYDSLKKARTVFLMKHNSRR